MQTLQYKNAPLGRSGQRRRVRGRRGTMAALMACLLPVVLAVAAFAINVVYMELARTELQISIDVATRAAGRVLAVTHDQQQAIAAADRLLTANPFANKTMPLSGTDLVFGVSTRYAETDRYSFAVGPKPNAVKIAASGKVQVPSLFPTMGMPMNFRPVKISISTQTELDIALVLDRSGSMAFGANEISGNYNPAAAPLGWKFGDAVPPQSRWLDAVNAVHSFLVLMSQSGHDEHVSLSSYNDKAKTDLDLTNNYASIDLVMQQYSAKFDGGATNIGDGILEGATALSAKNSARPWATRVMIVLTDGIHNTGTDPLLAAQYAASQNIMIYTVTFSSEADITKMEEVAAIGSGKHIHAATGAELVSAFDEIAHSLPTLITY